MHRHHPPVGGLVQAERLGQAEALGQDRPFRDAQGVWPLKVASARAFDEWLRSPTPPPTPPRFPCYSIAAPDLSRSSVFTIDAILSLWERPPAAADIRAKAEPAAVVGPGSAANVAQSAKDQKRRARYGWVDEFLFLAVKHPEWTIPRLAKEVGITPQTVYRAEETQDRIARLIAHRRAPDYPVRADAD
jgi:hypothetical protein